MKKEIKIAIAVVLSIWFFVMGFELGIYKERKANVQSGNEVVNTVTPTAQPTTQPTTVPTTVPTTAPTTLPPVVDPNQNSTAPSEAASTEAPANNDPSSLSKAQIVEKINTHMKALKSEQNLQAHKTEKIDVSVVDCSVPAAVSLINNIISGIAGTEEADYSFANGTTTAGETVYACITPESKDFYIAEEGVATATATASGTDTVYTIVLVEENTTLTAPVPTHNATTVGYLDIASLDLPSVTIATADMKYPGSTVEITVNADGKITKLVNKIPMSGKIGAKISFFEGDATIEGGQDESWTFTY